MSSVLYNLQRINLFSHQDNNPTCLDLYHTSSYVILLHQPCVLAPQGMHPPKYHQDMEEPCTSQNFPVSDIAHLKPLEFFKMKKKKKNVVETLFNS
jgi:hypothetical protein